MSKAEIPDYMVRAHQQAHNDRREREAAEAARLEAERPVERLKYAATGFHGWWGDLDNELHRRASCDEYFVRFLDLAEELRGAVTDGKFADFWDCVEAGFRPRGQSDGPEKEIRFWLESDRRTAEAVYRTQIGLNRWMASQPSFGFEISEFTRDYLYLRTLGAPRVLDDMPGRVGGPSKYRIRLTEYHHPETVAFREAFDRRFPNAVYDARSIGEFCHRVARQEGYDADAIRQRTIDWAIAYLTGAGGNPPNEKDVRPPSGEMQPGRKPDGPDGVNVFRFAGAEVHFGRAALQYRLVSALWDARNGSPAEPRSVEDVMTDVYGLEQQTEDSTFRQLCTDARGKLERSNCPLTIAQVNGKVMLSPA